MSEFKFACPVCGQHMQCDSSQAGLPMECPTCFQKITPPQTAASDDQKFILTGTKYVEKKNGLHPHGTAYQPALQVRKRFPIWIIFVIVAVLASASGIVFLQQARVVPKSQHGKALDTGLPPDWRAEDIGNVDATGAVSVVEGVFTVSGSGADIWHRADGFQFVFQSLNGDGSLTACLLNIQNTDEWAKGGVMIRESTNASSMFALASVRSDGQAQSIWRGMTGMEAQASALVGGMGCPKWVKIARAGNTFSMYYKMNATNKWLQMGATQTIRMGTNAMVGLFVCSHNNGVICQAQFDKIALQMDNQGTGK